jgi:hypothetical protein
VVREHQVEPRPPGRRRPGPGTRWRSRRTRRASRAGRGRTASPRRLAGPFRPPDQASSGSFLPGRPGRRRASADSSAISAGSSRRPCRARTARRTRVRRLGEVDILVDVVQRTAVGHPGGEPLDDRQRLHRPDQVGGRQHPQRLHVLAVPLDLAAGQLTPVFAVPGGPLEQRIVHVGDVLHVDNGEPGAGGGGASGTAGGLGIWGIASSQARTSRSQAV